MSALAKFKIVLFDIAIELSSKGFRRRGAWFTKRPPEGSYFSSINIRKIPQAGSKRITFQVVSYAGRTTDGDMSLVTSLGQALDHSLFEHRITQDHAEMFWTVWPSSDPHEIGRLVYSQIAQQSMEALERHFRESCQGST